MQNVLNEPVNETWIEIAPFLDAAMASLNKTDRQVLLLRFFDEKSLAEVGAALGTAENTRENARQPRAGKIAALFR